MLCTLYLCPSTLIPLPSTKLNLEQLKKEIQYRTSRSGGKGGQSVNKLETKVEARLALHTSFAFSEADKTWLLEKLADRLTAEGELIVTNQTERSQLANKQKAEQKLIQIIIRALRRPKRRKAITISPEAKAARGREKQRRSEQKASRRKVRLNDLRQPDE